MGDKTGCQTQDMEKIVKMKAYLLKKSKDKVCGVGISFLHHLLCHNTIAGQIC